MACEFLDFAFGRMGMLPRGIIHVGANSGQEVREYSTRGIRSALFIEPGEDAFAALEKEVHDSGNERFVALKAACWSEDNATFEFQISDNEGLSSSLLEPTGHLLVHPEVGFGNVQRVRTARLDTLLASPEGQIGSQCDALVLDVQGAELQVLAGSTATLENIKYVWIEVSWGGLYQGDSTLEEVIEQMADYGFRMAYLAMTRWSWGNAMFLSNSVVQGLSPAR